MHFHWYGNVPNIYIYIYIYVRISCTYIYIYIYISAVTEMFAVVFCLGGGSW